MAGQAQRMGGKMTIVELPEDTTRPTWIDLEDDGRTMVRVWGTVEVKAMQHGRWHITILNQDSIIAFIYADAIRRK